MSEFTDNLQRYKEALSQFLSMPTADLRILARKTGVPKVILERWRDEGEWIALRTQCQSAQNGKTVDTVMKERSRTVLHSCDVVLRLLTRDLNRYARQVQPDQHQMLRLMRIINEFNKMAVESMEELSILESKKKEETGVD
ncbi:MAG: hypothetical protein U0103_29865 [Candidatus Obscuribacterales bacterium]